MMFIKRVCFCKYKTKHQTTFSRFKIYLFFCFVFFYTYILLIQDVQQKTSRSITDQDWSTAHTGSWSVCDEGRSRWTRSFQPDVFVSNICVIAGGVPLPRELQGYKKKKGGNYRLNMKHWICVVWLKWDIFTLSHCQTVFLNGRRFVMQRVTFSFSPPRLGLMTKRWVTAPL